MRRNRRTVQRSQSSSDFHSEEEESSEHALKASSGEEDSREPRKRHGRKQASMDFKVEIPEFEGQLKLLNPDEFIDWMNTVERVFEYKDIPDGKKVKLVALKVRRYASIWWNNVLRERTQKGKGKICTWRKMKEKVKSKFLPPHYLRVWKSIPGNLRNLS